MHLDGGLPSDQDLIDETRLGSSPAFDALMQRYERLVYSVALSYTRERESALDVTQEVFFKVYRKLASYRGDAPFRIWLLRIAGREATNWLRKHRRSREADELPPDLLAPQGTGGTASPEERLALEKDALLLRSGIERLPMRQRLAVTMRYFEGMHLREVAAVLGCTEVMGKNLLYRGLQRLREEMAGKLEARRA